MGFQYHFHTSIQWSPEMKKRCRRWLLSLAAVCFGTMLIFGYCVLKNSIPDEIRITEDNDEELTEVFSNIADNHLLDVSGIILYLSLIVLFFFLTMQMIQKRRWS